jgi:hypothetical protein
VRFRATGHTLIALLLSMTVTFATAPTASSSEQLQRPNRDPFYRYTGATPLSQIRPGTPLRVRSVTLGADTNETPLPAKQILYRTKDATGHAVVSVTTVVLPATGTSVPRVVAYLSYYDALSSKCDPSYTLRGGDPGAANRQLADLEQGVVHTLHENGYIVTVPDLEDERLDFGAGTEYGMSSLDGIKATLKVLKLGTHTPVGLMGYSGGSIGADWASELQPVYAPRLHLVGTAMGGLPVNFAHNLRYVDGSASWSDVIPAAMIGISRSFHLDLRRYLSAWGQRVVGTVSHQCIGEYSGEYPHLTVKRLMKPRYTDILRVPLFHRIVTRLRMGRAPGHPTDPLLMVWGNSDGTGDGIMIAADQQALAAHYCKEGVPVTSEELQGLDHGNAGAAFLAQAPVWLASRFAGAPPASNCSGTASPGGIP